MNSNLHSSQPSVQQIRSFANLIMNQPKLLDQLFERVYDLLERDLFYTSERTGR